MLALLIFLNGRLDHSRVNPITITVLSKSACHSRRGDRYTLEVASWRPGRSRERLGVGKSVYDRAAIGRPAITPLRRGFFGLPWHGPLQAQ